MSGDRADLSAPKRTRFLVMALVAMIHVSVILGLIQAFAPGFASQVADTVLSTFTVTITAPPPAPPPQPQQPHKAGAAAEAGKRAVPREAASVKPRLAIARPTAAPPVAAHGPDNSAGARDAGAGTGAGGQGNGTGSGNGGNGQGGGAATKVVKIAGDINSARDYPRETMDLRIGDSVTVALTVGSDGRVKSCRVHRASRDSQADQITCRLAMERFRFRPATDANGNPVESTFGWRQRWFYPGGNN